MGGRGSSIGGAAKKMGASGVSTLSLQQVNEELSYYVLHKSDTSYGKKTAFGKGYPAITQARLDKLSDEQKLTIGREINNAKSVQMVFSGESSSAKLNLLYDLSSKSNINKSIEREKARLVMNKEWTKAQEEKGWTSLVKIGKQDEKDTRNRIKYFENMKKTLYGGK